MMDNVFGRYRIAVPKTTRSSNPAYHARSGVSFEWDYVVKVYATRPMYTQEEEEIFRRHIEALQQLENTYILPITDYGFKQYIPFYVTRQLNHGSLRERLEQELTTSLSIQDMITVIVQVGQALQYIHDHHIIHGNIKPENILFDTNNDVRLVDFRLPNNIDEMHTINADVTSFMYYPKGEPLDEKSEQYALGCLANELFGSLLPSTQALLAVPLSDMAQETSTLAFSRSTNEVLRRIKTRLMKAMARDPKARYENIATFVEALNEVGSAQFVITSSEPIIYARPGSVNKIFHRVKTLGPMFFPPGKQRALIKDKFIQDFSFIVVIALLCFILSGSVMLFFSGNPARQTAVSSLSTAQGLNGTGIFLTPQAINPMRQPVLTMTSDVVTRVVSPVATALPTVGPSPTPTASPPATLAGHWNFDQARGSTASDVSGNGYTGILRGEARWGPPHAGSSAISLNGSYRTNVDIPTPVVNTAHSFSVSAWVKVSSFNNNYQTFVSIDGDKVSGFYLQWRPDTHKFGFMRLGGDGLSTTVSIASASSVPVADAWYNLVGVYDASAQTIALYVNGNLQQTLAYTGSWQAAGHTEIGRSLYNGKPVDFVVGEIDSVYIYRGALTASGIASLVAAG